MLFPHHDDIQENLIKFNYFNCSSSSSHLWFVQSSSELLIFYMYVHVIFLN